MSHTGDEITSRGDMVLYVHHGRHVWVRKDLRGRHREMCLCYRCTMLDTQNCERNCPIANALFALNALSGITTPVFECVGFLEDKHEAI